MTFLLSIFSHLNAQYALAEIFKVMIIVMIFFYLFGFWISLGGTVQIYTPELIPETGVVLCVLSQWIMAWFVTFLFPILKQNYKIITIHRQAFGLSFCFFGFSFFILIGIIVVILYGKETKGLTTQQIDELFL